MPRITRVTTRGGDGGETSLGGGRRAGKDSLRIEVYGTVDELGSVIGLAISMGVDAALVPELQRIQNELFHLGADLATPEEDKERTPGPRIEPRHVSALEALIERTTGELPPLENFVLPGGAPTAALLHLARTVCRRAERALVALARTEPIGALTIPYLNRLSDALFVMARWENRAKGVDEPVWDSRA